MNQLPHRKAILKSVREYDVLDDLGRKPVASTSPKGGQAKLGIHLHLRLFQEAFSRMVELAHEREIQLELPFLNQCQLHRTEVVSSREQREWASYKKIVGVLPVSEGQLRLNKSVILQLQVLPKSAVFPMKNSMRGRTNVELRL